MLTLPRFFTFSCVLSLMATGAINDCVRAQNFRAQVDGNLNNLANWEGGVIPPADQTVWVNANGFPTLFMSSDLALGDVILTSQGPGLGGQQFDPLEMDFRGNTLDANISYGVGFVNSIRPSSKLLIRDGSMVGNITTGIPISFTNVEMRGNVTGNWPERETRAVLDNVSGNIPTWQVSNISFAKNTLEITNSSTLDFGGLSNDWVQLHQASTVTSERLAANRLEVREQSQLTNGASRIREVFVHGESSKADLGALENGGTGALTKVDVRDGGSLSFSIPSFQHPNVTAPVQNFVVDGIDSGLSVDASARGIWSMHRTTPTETVFGKVTNGGVVEVAGLLSLSAPFLSIPATPVRLDLLDGTFRGSLALTQATVHLEDGLIEGASFLVNWGELSGHGTVDVAFSLLNNATIIPDGLLNISGVIQGTGRWWFDIEDSDDFDVVELDQINGAQDLRILFTPGFRASVGTEFDVFRVRNGSTFGPTMARNMQVQGLPEGYAYSTIVDGNSVGLVITAVPEVGGRWLVCLGLGIWGVRMVAGRVRRRLTA